MLEQPCTVTEYLRDFEDAAQFLVSAQDEVTDAPTYLQLWAQAWQTAKAALELGDVPRSYVDDTEVEILARLGIQVATYLNARRVHTVYALGLVHSALEKISTGAIVPPEMEGR